MALIKMKPTSAGRRGMVEVVNASLHKGAPEASLLEKKIRGSGRNNNGHITDSPQGRRAQATLPRGGLPSQQGRHPRQGRASSSTTPTAPRAHRAAVLRRRRASLHHRSRAAWKWAPRCCRASKPRSAPATRCRSATSRSAPTIHCIETACPARARRWPARPARPPRCWPAKAPTPRSACAPAKCAACTSSAAPPSAKSATKNTACARSARPVRCVGMGIRPTVRGVVMNPVDHPHGGGEGTDRRRSCSRSSPWGYSERRVTGPVATSARTGLRSSSGASASKGRAL